VALGFAEEEVNVLWHEDVGVDSGFMRTTGSFDYLFQDVFGFGGFEVGKTAVAAEGDEVELSCVLTSF